MKGVRPSVEGGKTADLFFFISSLSRKIMIKLKQFWYGF